MGADGLWKAQVPDVKTRQRHFTELLVNDQRRFRPRLPETGFKTVGDPGISAIKW